MKYKIYILVYKIFGLNIMQKYLTKFEKLKLFQKISFYKKEFCFAKKRTLFYVVLPIDEFVKRVNRARYNQSCLNRKVRAIIAKYIKNLYIFYIKNSVFK